MGDPMMALSELKTRLRSGPYAWPGGYPVFFVTTDGGALSYRAVRECWREVVSAHLRNDRRCGWAIDGADINWEDEDLICDHTGERIENAYGENTP
jgi:hypothetical protein